MVVTISVEGGRANRASFGSMNILHPPLPFPKSWFAQVNCTVKYSIDERNLLDQAKNGVEPAKLESSTVAIVCVKMLDSPSSRICPEEMFSLFLLEKKKASWLLS